MGYLAKLQYRQSCNIGKFREISKLVMLGHGRSLQTIYFTVVPLPNSGFTDQILQFSSFYKLGLLLGYKYIHTPFINSRSSRSIFNFLGFNDSFRQDIVSFRIIKFIRLKKIRFIKLKINDHLLNHDNKSTFQELKNFIEQLVANTLESAPSDGVNIIQFKLKPRGRQFFKVIHAQSPNFPDQLDLRATYFRKRAKNPLKSRFTHGKVKLLVHIRLGDIATIKTPWHTFITLSDSNTVTEISDLDSAAWKSVLAIQDYYKFLKVFVSNFDPDLFSIVVSSDGYGRAFSEIQKNIKELELNPNQARALKELESVYENESFKVFEKLNDLVCIVGERDENLHDLIHSCLTADIIIVGNRQRMLPKLIASYYDLKNPKTFIVLHKSGKPPNYAKDLSLHSRKARVIPVNLSNFNIKDVVAQLNSELPSKIGIPLPE